MSELVNPYNENKNKAWHRLYEYIDMLKYKFELTDCEVNEIVQKNAQLSNIMLNPPQKEKG